MSFYLLFFIWHYICLINKKSLPYIFIHWYYQINYFFFFIILVVRFICSWEYFDNTFSALTNRISEKFWLKRTPSLSFEQVNLYVFLFMKKNVYQNRWMFYCKRDEIFKWIKIKYYVYWFQKYFFNFIIWKVLLYFVQLEYLRRP